MNSMEFCPAIYFPIGPGARYTLVQKWYRLLVRRGTGTEVHSNENCFGGIIYSDEIHICPFGSCSCQFTLNRSGKTANAGRVRQDAVHASEFALDKGGHHYRPQNARDLV